MLNDPIVQEIHDIRRRILEECGGDVDRLIARLKAAESRDEQRLVTIADLQKRTAHAGRGTDAATTAPLPSE